MLSSLQGYAKLLWHTYSVRQQKTENFWGPLFQLRIKAEVSKLHVGIVLILQGASEKTAPIGKVNYYALGAVFSEAPCNWK